MGGNRNNNQLTKMNITNIEMRRCLSGYESNHTLAVVARLTWQEEGKTYGVEMEAGPSEEDLLLSMSKCLDSMLQSLEYRWASRARNTGDRSERRP